MPIEVSPQRWTRAAKFVGLPLAGFALLQFDSVYPFVRFSNELANVFVGTTSYLLPFVAMIFALIIPRHWWSKVIITLVLLPLSLLCLMVCLLGSPTIGDILRTGVNGEFELINRASMGGYSVGIYRTNCGATCSFGIYPLQEKQIIPGVLLVRALGGFYPADNAAFKILGKDALLLQVPEYFDGEVRTPARERVYHLKRFLYF